MTESWRNAQITKAPDHPAIREHADREHRLAVVSQIERVEKLAKRKNAERHCLRAEQPLSLVAVQA